MAYDRLNLGASNSGKTVRAIYWNAETNAVFIPGTGLTEAWVDANASTYVVNVPEVGTTGIYAVSTPAAVPTPYVVDYYEAPAGVLSLFQHLGTGSGGDTPGVTTLLSLFAGMTSMSNWLRNMVRKTNPDPTASAEINANNGVGIGTYDPATDSHEAIRDRGDLAWLTGSGSGGGGNLIITPILASAANPRYSTRDLAPIAQHSGAIDIVTLVEGTGAPLDLTGRTLRFVAYAVTEENDPETRYDDVIAAAFKYETGAGLTIGGPDSNQVTIQHDPAKTATAGVFHYYLWDVTTPGSEIVLMKGKCPIEPAMINYP